MVVSIHQPNYLPWIGYFYKIAKSDAFIVLDDVQFSKGDYINRVKIYSPQKKEQWLTIPLFANKLQTKISEVKISKEWKQLHLKTIQQVYCKTKYFEEIFKKLQEIYSLEYDFLAEINIAFIEYIIEGFGINVDLYKSSDIKIKELKSDDKLIELVKTVRGTVYISGRGGFNYQDVNKFYNAGIKIISYTIDKNFTYTTKYTNGPKLSILDFIFNESFNTDKLLKFGELDYENSSIRSSRR